MLEYAFIDNDPSLSAIPQRLSNGGLDTGPQATGPWGNISVKPDIISLSTNLSSANPPPYAQKQPMSFNRNGNNTVEYPNHQMYNPEYCNLRCIKTPS